MSREQVAAEASDSAARRLKAARERAGHGSARKAAISMGLPYPSYKAHESGGRGFKFSAAQKYAAAFNVSVGWLVSGENPPDWYGDNGGAPMYPQKAEGGRAVSREQIEARIMAAAYTAAAEFGHNEAIRLLEKALAAIRNAQWGDR